ncbi:MAG: DUF4229 domain-containing protein, partial [Microbacteriaceae bacterium]|nr:DUF4229 domain-containing protein [Microbacteriaceae bacterium]
MDLSRAWIIYVAVRLVSFVVPFALVMLALPGWEWNWLLGAVFGALASQAISVIALRPHRERIAQGLAERRAAEERPRETRRAIDLEEDADLDAHEAADAPESAEPDARRSAEPVEARPDPSTGSGASTDPETPSDPE